MLPWQGKGCVPFLRRALGDGARTLSFGSIFRISTIWRLLSRNPSMKCAMQYAAIEFMPTTTSGNAHFLKPFTSITQLKAARNKKQTPPLKMVHDGVQMRFTTGQMSE